MKTLVLLLSVLLCCSLGISTVSARVTDAQIDLQKQELQPFYSDPLNVGVDLDELARIKAEVAAGLYDRPCNPNEHDPHEWHMLVSPEHGCHYNHHHGDNPNILNDVCAQRPDGSEICFGEPGAWFDKPGQSVSYPWQTFVTEVSASPFITAEEAGALDGKMENQAKHEGYFWIVRTNQPCADDGEYCTTDYRLQFHGMMFMHGALTRYHSMSYESRVCQDPADPTTCGIMRRGGWADFGILMAPEYDESYRCSGAGSSRYGDAEIEVFLDLENQFFDILPPNHPDRYVGYPPGVDDRFRCHNILTDKQLEAHIANGESNLLAQWWIRDPQRHQIRFFDPIGNVIESPEGSQEFIMDFYCEMDHVTLLAADPDCRMNQSKFTSAAEYLTGFGEAIAGNWDHGTHDFDGDLLTDVTREIGIYTDRWGSDSTATCTAPALDCIPYVIDNLTINRVEWGAGHYDHYECRADRGDSCPVLDHDLTPPGQPSWINWFYRYMEPEIPNPGATVDNDGCSTGVSAECGLIGSFIDSVVTKTAGA